MRIFNLSSFDIMLFKFINSGCACSVMDKLMLFATWLGEGIVQTGICLILIFTGLIMNRVILRRAGYAGLMAYAISGIAAQIVKHIWDRPRPLLVLFDVRTIDRPLFLHSFPSGHTVTAFAAAFVFGAYMPKLRYLFILLAVATGISRIYLGVHFPTDVIIGAVIGAATGILSVRLVSPHPNKSTIKKAEKSTAK